MSFVPSVPSSGSGSVSGSFRPRSGRSASARKSVGGPGPAGGAGVVNGNPQQAAQAIKMYGDVLTDYEQSEVFDYQHIYFVGPAAQKIKGKLDNVTRNHGYDDDRGDFLFVPNDHIAYRYEVTHQLGRGSFGQVLKAFDYKYNMPVAIKIIRNKKRFHVQAQIEAKILDHLRTNDPDDQYNVVRMIEYFYFRNHLCITFELLSINLYEFIKNNNFQGLTPTLIRKFAVQLLTSLKYIHAENLIHCDLKPENILLRAPTKSAIKLIDYGSSCFEHERLYTYIQSRFYRAPEIILGFSYGRPIDMWSFGCIMCELFTGYPIFPGENETEQLACIMEVLDVPPRHIIEAATRRKQFFDTNWQPRIVPNSRGRKRKPGTKDLVKSLRCNDVKFLNFVEGFLRWDPRERLTAEQGLRHEWILEGFPPTPPMENHDQSQARQHRTTSQRLTTQREGGNLNQPKLSSLNIVPFLPQHTASTAYVEKDSEPSGLPSGVPQFQPHLTGERIHPHPPSGHGQQPFRNIVNQSSYSAQVHQHSSAVPPVAPHPPSIVQTAQTAQTARAPSSNGSMVSSTLPSQYSGSSRTTPPSVRPNTTRVAGTQQGSAAGGASYSLVPPTVTEYLNSLSKDATGAQLFPPIAETKKRKDEEYDAALFELYGQASAQ